VAGSTSDTVPTTVGAFQPQSAGSYDVFLAKLAPPAARFFTVAPCRLVDTRGNPGPFGAPALSAGTTRTFTIAGQCSVPVTARAVSVNITATGPSAPGDLRLYPANMALPLASNLNYSAGQTRANNAILSLNGAGALTVFCEQASGTVDFVLDVNGYLQ
jgi:hypothetical protein